MEGLFKWSSLGDCVDEGYFIEGQSELEKFRCPICMGIMVNSIEETKNHHSFGTTCLLRLFESNLVRCPVCRVSVEMDDLAVNDELEGKFKNLQVRCINYKKKCTWQGFAGSMRKHLFTCPFSSVDLKNLLNKCVEKMKKIIGQEITPHLIAEHLDIYESEVKDWNFLYTSLRDWKDWWWSFNYYWDSGCNVCNELWQKYNN